MNYQQLTREQRYQIHALMKAGHSRTDMAAIIDVHKSTIARELHRNRGGRGYRPEQAHENAAARKQRQRSAAATRLAPQTWLTVGPLLRQDWSPEQISGWLKREHQPGVSHERIYQHTHADKAAGGDLHCHLRCRKRRRERYGVDPRRGQIPERTGIEHRPKVVETRRRLGERARRYDHRPESSPGHPERDRAQVKTLPA